MTIKPLNWIILIAILVSGMAAFMLMQGNAQAQRLVGITLSLAYVIWGITTHTSHEKHHAKVVIEYLLLGAVAILVVLTVIRP